MTQKGVFIFAALLLRRTWDVTATVADVGSLLAACAALDIWWRLRDAPSAVSPRITWLRYLRRTLLKHDFQLSDPLSGVLSGNECFLKMQMPLAEGKQVRELDSDHFSFSSSLLFVASPLQGILTGTDKPLYGLNWIGFLLSKVWSCSMVEIKDFIHCPSARLSLSAQFSAFHVAVSHLCL